ncbi:MAG: tyrosinase family protein [Terricaulis sp.]
MAIAHKLDCPHGNWWFLPWHRAFLGWFEQTCRQLSGDPEFALPYWDWTATPRVPDQLFSDVLTPTNELFIADFAEFKRRFEGPVSQMRCWTAEYDVDGAFNANSQYALLLDRGLRTPADLWFDIGSDPRWKLFFDRQHARGLTRDRPDLDEPTKKTVELPALLEALAPRDFVTFASPKTFAHSSITGFGTLEGRAHNRVHNCVGGVFTHNGHSSNSGGFMQENLSPVDPIFFLHHANIDRLWDLWTRKQQANRYPTLPDGYLTPDIQTPRPTDYKLWSDERLLFFVDSQGEPVTKNRASDYAAIGDFDYDYEPGSGHAELLGPEAESTPTPVAFITVDFPRGHSETLHVLVNAPDDASWTENDPHHAGELTMFGHHTMCGPVTFAVPLARTLAAIRRTAIVDPNAPVNVRVVARPSGSAHFALHTAAALEARIIVEMR